MSHQPFENWILDLNALTGEERRSLQAHLETCSQCQKLQRRWQAVHWELQARRMVAPAPGFTQRWQSSLAERRAREQRKQAWWVFFACLGAALLVLLIITGYVLATSTPTDLLTAGIQYLSSSINLFNLAASLVKSWLAATPLALDIVLWMYLAFTLCLLSAIWVLALWRTSHVGVFNK